MKILLIVFLFLMGLSGRVFYHIPRQQAGCCKKVMDLPGKDSIFMNEVNFCRDETGKYFYFSNINTPVCNDTRCQIITLNVYWDLGGHYIRFDTLLGNPLTKFDHEPFTQRDYEKLQMTLSNENSILGEKAIDELLDTDRRRYSEKIDAVTGATSREIQSAVVEGALYSTYTLWQLVNNRINSRMREYTFRVYDQDIEDQLLNAENPETILFGLSHLEDTYFTEHFNKILEIMRSNRPLLNFYIAKRIPPSIYDDINNRNSLLELWKTLDRNTRSVLAPHLAP